MYIDSHCHIHYKGLIEHLPEILSNMQKMKVTHALCVNIDLKTFPELMNVVKSESNIFGSVGVHPGQECISEPEITQLISLAQHKKIVAIGETGLDYYKQKYSYNDMELQRERFRKHIFVSRQLGKPLIIHTRGAVCDTIQLMREEHAYDVGGVMHCFTENWETAKITLDLGFYISISGIVTFKNANALREVARQIPDDRLLIETDSPYLAPVPHRGKINQPSYITHTVNFLAALRGVDTEYLGQVTTENFFRLFGKQIYK